MTIYISEPEFAARIKAELQRDPLIGFRWVTGPGRSGAIAAVYLSHMAGLSYVPYGSRAPDGLPGIVVDTATLTGATLRKAGRRYPMARLLALYDERALGRHIFWYEAAYKPHQVYSCPKCFAVALTKTDRCEQCKEMTND